MPHPYGPRHLLGCAVWSADTAWDALCAYVAEYLDDPCGVVVVAETGFPKKGAHSAGVALQYCGMPGKVGNYQVGGFLAYVGPRSHKLPGRELYLTKGWTKDGACLQEAGLALDTPLATKPQLARRMPGGRSTRGCPWPGAWGTRATATRARCRSWLEDREWHWLSAGAVSKGERWYDW